MQEIDAQKQPGFLIYLPVYAGDEEPESVDERRQRLRGFVYAPFRAGDLFSGIFGGSTPPVAFRVLDDGPGREPALLYDSNAAAADDRTPAFRRETATTLFGHRWLLEFTSLPAVEERSGQIVAPLIAVAGLLVSLLLFELTRREVRARAQAQHSERVRSRFYASMSHELRTPLNAIIGYNDLILAGIYGPLADPQRGGLERSQKAARHLLDLVNDVLDLSKIESGKMELSARAGGRADAGRRPVRHAARHSRGAWVHAQRSCDGTAEPLVTDPRRLRQILLNLLSNAIKFGEGRPIEVRCAPEAAAACWSRYATTASASRPPTTNASSRSSCSSTAWHPGAAPGWGFPSRAASRFCSAAHCRWIRRRAVGASSGSRCRRACRRAPDAVQNRSPFASRIALPTGRMRPHMVWKKSAIPSPCANAATMTTQAEPARRHRRPQQLTDQPAGGAEREQPVRRLGTRRPVALSAFSGRGKSHSATPRIIIITNPTSIACVCALTSYGVGYRCQSSRRTSIQPPSASPTKPGSRSAVLM